MSSIRESIVVHQRLQLDRRRARMQVESMWDDGVARAYFDVLDELEQADREYERALQELDATLAHAIRWL
jgi:uncharacterized protein YukE